MTRPYRLPFAAALLAVLLAGSGLAGSGCAPLASSGPAAILERVADGDYDVGIRYPSKRTRYVMIVEEDEESFTLTNRPAGGREADAAAATPDGAARPAMPQRSDRVLAPCTEAAGDWYRHTPAGYVCVGRSVPGTGAGG